MEQFIELLAEKIAQYRASLEPQGFSDEELTQKTEEYMDMKLSEYYEKLMATFSEADYQIYKRALEEGDKEAVQGILGKYHEAIERVKGELLENF
jgi:hypothetical protein